MPSKPPSWEETEPIVAPKWEDTEEYSPDEGATLPDFMSQQPPGEPWRSGVVRSTFPGILKPQDLFPAVRKIGGELAVGEQGDTHPDIIKREGITANDLDQRGFVGPQGEFMDREAAAQATGVPTDREPGRLHSTDLIRELDSPTDEKSVVLNQPGYVGKLQDIANAPGSTSTLANLPAELLGSNQALDIQERTREILANRAQVSDRERRTRTEEIRRIYRAKLAQLPWDTDPQRANTLAAQLDQWQAQQFADIGVEMLQAVERPRIGEPLTKQQQELLAGPGAGGAALGAAQRNLQGLATTFVQPEMLPMGPAAALEAKLLPKAERLAMSLLKKKPPMAQLGGIMGEAMIPQMLGSAAEQLGQALGHASQGDWEPAIEKGTEFATTGIMLSMPVMAARRVAEIRRRANLEYEPHLGQQMIDVEKRLSELEEDAFQTGQESPELKELRARRADIQNRIDLRTTVEQQVMDAAAGSGRKVIITDKDLGEGNIAQPFKGDILINRELLHKVLEIDAGGDLKRIDQVIQSLVNQEAIHAAIPNEIAAQYWDSLTSIEKAFEESLYPFEKGASSALKGQEALRRRIESANGLTPLEFLITTKQGRLGARSLDLMTRAFRATRESLATSGADKANLNQQLAILNRAQERILAARKGVKDALEPETAPVLQPVRDTSREGQVQVPTKVPGAPPDEGGGKKGLEGQAQVLLEQAPPTAQPGEAPPAAPAEGAATGTAGVSAPAAGPAIPQPSPAPKPASTEIIDHAAEAQRLLREVDDLTDRLVTTDSAEERAQLEKQIDQLKRERQYYLEEGNRQRLAAQGADPFARRTPSEMKDLWDTRARALDDILEHENKLFALIGSEKVSTEEREWMIERGFGGEPLRDYLADPKGRAEFIDRLEKGFGVPRDQAENWLRGYDDLHRKFDAAVEATRPERPGEQAFPAARRGKYHEGVPDDDVNLVGRAIMRPGWLRVDGTPVNTDSPWWPVVRDIVLDGYGEAQGSVKRGIAYQKKLIAEKGGTVESPMLQQLNEYKRRLDALADADIDYGPPSPNLDIDIPAARRPKFKGLPTTKQPELGLGTAWVLPGEQKQDIRGQPIQRAAEVAPPPGTPKPPPIALQLDAKAKEFASKPVVFGTRPSRRGAGHAPEVTKKITKFEDFEKWAKNNIPGVTRSQLESKWKDAVYGDMVNPTQERLAEFIEAYDLREKLGLPVDPDTGKVDVKRLPQAEEAYVFSLEPLKEGEKAKKRRKAPEGVATSYGREFKERGSVEKFAKIVSAITQARLAELRRPANLTRKEFGFQDIDFGNDNTVVGAYRKINPTEAKNPDSLQAIFKDEARTRGEPVSNTKRLGAFVDTQSLVEVTIEGKTKQVNPVEVLSTYNDSGTQMVVDPVGHGIAERPNRPMDAAFLKRYRPIASILLAEPIKDFRKRYNSVREYEAAVEKFALDRERATDRFPGESADAAIAAEREQTRSELDYWRNELMGVAERQEQGTPGLRGQGGIFRGPGAGEARAEAGLTGGEIARSYNEPLYGSELEAIIDWMHLEFGDTPQDFYRSIATLRDLAKEDLKDQQRRAELERKQKKGQTPYQEALKRLLKKPRMTEAEAKRQAKKIAWRELMARPPQDFWLKGIHRKIISALQKISNTIYERSYDKETKSYGLTPDEAYKRALAAIAKNIDERIDLEDYIRRTLKQFGERPDEPGATPPTLPQILARSKQPSYREIYPRLAREPESMVRPRRAAGPPERITLRPPAPPEGVQRDIMDIRAAVPRTIPSRRHWLEQFAKAEVPQTLDQPPYVAPGEGTQVTPSQYEAIAHTVSLSEILKKTKPKEVVSYHQGGPEALKRLSNVERRFRPPRQRPAFVLKRPQTGAYELRAEGEIAPTEPTKILGPLEHPPEGPAAKRKRIQSVSNNPEFRKWFGRSAIVDQEGLPKEVYHGTSDVGDFTSFDPGKTKNRESARRSGWVDYLGQAIYFSDRPKDAGDFSLYEGSGEDARVIPAFIRMEKPFDTTKPMRGEEVRAIANGAASFFERMTDEEKSKLLYGNDTIRRMREDIYHMPRGTPEDFYRRSLDQHRDEFDDSWYGTQSNVKSFYKWLADYVSADGANRYLRSLGYDGIIDQTHDMGKQYAVFDPRQVKSSIGNSGKFSESGEFAHARRPSFEQQAERYKRTSDALAAAVSRGTVRGDIRPMLVGLTTGGEIDANQAFADIHLAAYSQPLKSLSRSEKKQAQKRANMLDGAARAVIATIDPVGTRERELAKVQRRQAIEYAFQQGLTPTTETLEKIPQLAEFKKLYPVEKTKPNLNNINKLVKLCDIGIAKANKMMANVNPVDKLVGRSWLKAALRLRQEVIDARDNWNDPALHAVAEEFGKKMTDQMLKERSSGMSVEEYQNYVPGILESPIQHHSFLDVSGMLHFSGLKLMGKNFRMQKRFHNQYEAIANGPYTPAGWRLSDIAAHRIRRGNHVIAMRQWENGLKGITDPESKEPLAVDAWATHREIPAFEEGTGERKIDPDTGQPATRPEWGWRVPPKLKGYVLVDPSTGKEGTQVWGARKPICVKEGYQDLVKSMTGTSEVRKYLVGRGFLYSTSFLKHNWVLMLDTFHLGRLGEYAMAAAPGMFRKITGRASPGFGVGYKGGFTAISYSAENMQRAADLGLIPQGSVDWAKQTVALRLSPKKTVQISRKDLLDQILIPAGLSPRRTADAIYLNQVSQIPGLSHYNHFLFDHFVPGLLAETAVRNFESMHNANPHVPYRALAKDVARDVNVIYGQMHGHSLIKNKTFRDLTQIMLLAPFWREGLVQKDLRAMARLPAAAEHGVRKALNWMSDSVDPTKNWSQKLTGRQGLPPMGALGGMVVRGALAYFTLAQIANLIWRKRFTWQNPEPDHKLDARLPIGEHGMWLPTLGVFGEMVGNYLRYGETSRNAWERVLKIGVNSLGPTGRMANVLYERKDPRGRSLTTMGSLAKAAALEQFPPPISLSAAMRGIANYFAPGVVSPNEPGMGWQRFAGMLGFKLEPGKDAQTRIRTIARRWAKGQEIPESPIDISPKDVPSYNNLRHALKIGDKAEAQRVYTALLQRYDKTPRSGYTRDLSSEEMINRAMTRHSNLPFTGSADKESEFIGSLSPDEEEIYRQADRERILELMLFDAFERSANRSRD